MSDIVIALVISNSLVLLSCVGYLLSRSRRRPARGLCCVEGCTGTAAVFIWTDRGPAAFCGDCAELLADQARRRGSVPGN